MKRMPPAGAFPPRSPRGDGGIGDLPSASRQPAFTLVEVLATIMIVGIVLPVVARGISICVKAEGTAKTTLEAMSLADGKLAELTAYTTWQGGGLSGDFLPEQPGYRWSAASIDRGDGLQEVVVVVTWTEAALERSRTLSTLVYRSTAVSQ